MHISRISRNDIIAGLTLATEDDADVVPGRPIYISALQENGLAERTKTIQVLKKNCIQYQITRLFSWPPTSLKGTDQRVIGY